MMTLWKALRILCLYVDKYVDEIETSLDKDRIKSKLKSLYVEAGDLEI